MVDAWTSSSRARRPLLPAGRFLHRSLAARRARGHHPCPCRSRALRLRAYLCHATACRSCASGSATIDDRRRRLTARPSSATASRSRCIRPGTCWARRRCASSTRARSGSPPATTSSRADGTCAPFEPVRCHAFITESTFGLPIYRWRAASRDLRRDQRLVARATPSRARQRAVRLCARQGAAHPGAARPRDRPDRLPRRGRADERDLSRARRRAAADARRRRGMAKAALASALVARAAVGRRQRLAEALRRLFRRVRQRLDAGARQPPPARRRPGLRRCPTTPTGRGCSRPSRRPAPQRVFVTHGSTATLVRYLAREGLDAPTAIAAEYGDGGRSARGGRREGLRRALPRLDAATSTRHKTRR